MVQYLDNNSGFNQWKNMQANKPKKSFGLMWWIITFLFAWWIMGVWFKPQDTIVDNQNVVNIENSSLPTRQIDAEKISFDVQGLRVSNISLKDYSKAAKDKELVSLLKDENNRVVYIVSEYIREDILLGKLNELYSLGIRLYDAVLKSNLDNYLLDIESYSVIEIEKERRLSLV